MHQLKLDVIKESINEIWVAVQTTSPVLVSNIRLRLRSHANVAVLLGLSTAPSKEQLKKFADDGILQVLPSSPSTIGLSTHFFCFCLQFLLAFKGYRPYHRSHGFLFSIG